MRKSSLRGCLADAIQPVVEALESRRLLSVDLVGDTVSVVGTAGPDDISISVDGTDSTKYSVSDGVTTQTFDKSAVSRFVVAGKGGDDTIAVDSSNGKVDAPRDLRGGGGNDTIDGSGGKDNISGGAGDDSVSGGNGRDSLSGGDGNDTMNGDSGPDTVVGGTGDDSISGGAGDDSMLGEDGSDTMIGDAGDDSLVGGASDDHMFGAAGNDTVRGSGGNDVVGGDDEDELQLQGGPTVPSTFGDDLLVGGVGDDSILAHSGIDTLRGGLGSDVFDARSVADDLTDDNPQTDTIPAEDVFNEADAESLEITLNINVGGTPVVIPANAGDFSSGKSVAHAKDSNGTIEFRDNVSRSFTLGEFFKQWGVTFDGNDIGRFSTADGHALTMEVTREGVTTPSADFQNLVVQDGDVITIDYV